MVYLFLLLVLQLQLLWRKPDMMVEAAIAVQTSSEPGCISVVVCIEVVIVFVGKIWRQSEET